MLTKSKRLLSFVLSAFMLMTAMCMENAVTADAVDVSSASAFDIMEDMGTGWNLGNTFDATAATGLDAETSWGNPRTTQAMIDTVKKAGFNSVRIPVSWGIHTSGSDHTIDSAWMSRVKAVVDYCFNNDMYVILNIHHDTDKSYYYPTSDYLEQSKKYVSSVWTQIASEFKDYDEHLIFETLNEPRLVGTDDEWWFYRDDPNKAASDAISCINTLNQTAVDAIRGQGGKNSNRLIMCPGYCASIDGCTTPNFKLPTDTVSNRLVVSVHAYTPYNFALNANGTSTFSDDLKAEVDSLFEQINTKFISQGIPVIIGEVSASNKNNKDERIKWVDYYYGKAKQYGVPCMLWDNNAYNNPSNAGEAHGHLNRSALSWYDPNFINEIMSVLGISGGASGAQIPDLSACQITTLFSGNAQVTQWGYSESLVIKNEAGTADYDMRELGTEDFICVKYSGATPGIAVQKTTEPKVWVIAEPVKAENGIAYFSQKTLASAYGAAYESSVGSAVPSDFYDIGQCYISSKEGTVNVTEILIASTAATEPEVPAAAISQTYTSTGTGFTLNWAKVSGVTGYNVYKYDGANSKWVLVKTVTGADTLSTTVSGFTPGSLIKFKVNAYIQQNGKNYEGSTSDYLYAAALANAKISTNYTSTGTSYTLNWDKVQGATGYILYKFDGINKKWVKVKTVTGASTTSTTVTGITPGSVIKYKVNAYLTKGTKTYYGKTSDFLYAAAIAPCSFKSSYTATTTSASVNWNKVSGATGYKIYKYDSANKKWVLVKTITSASTTSATVTGLTSGTATKLKVNAYLTKGTKTYVGKAGTMLSVTTK